jgi:hypothetical protein
LRAFLICLCLGLTLPAVATAQQASPILSKLHDDLHLTADQDTAWRQYAKAVNDEGQMQARREAAQIMLPQLTTPRRLALMKSALTDELADFDRQSQAINVFYDRLTPAQQRTFDHDTLPTQNGLRG